MELKDVVVPVSSFDTLVFTSRVNYIIIQANCTQITATFYTCQLLLGTNKHKNSIMISEKNSILKCYQSGFLGFILGKVDLQIIIWKS